MNSDLIGPFPIIIWKEIICGRRSKNVLNLVSDLLNLSLTCKSLYDLIWNTPNIIFNDPKFNDVCPTCFQTLKEAIIKYNQLQRNLTNFFNDSLPYSYLPTVLNTQKCPCLYCKEFTEKIIYNRLELYHKNHNLNGLICSLSSVSPKYSDDTSLVLAVRYYNYGVFKKSLVQIKYDKITHQQLFCVLVSDNFPSVHLHLPRSASSFLSNVKLLPANNVYYNDWNSFIYHTFNHLSQFDLRQLGQIYQDYQEYNYSSSD